ncbi:MAG: tetratricopeptide repeat protein [Syntrophales bacterium LBB04]|nr:tetratricopeptide repeat protein [Syntrophales bacterium LBB04]
MTKVRAHRIPAMSWIGIFAYSCSLVTILIISGCATTMSLEEAKKVSLAIEEKPAAKPPRHITDILAILDQPGHMDISENRISKMEIDASALPPAEADDQAMADFYFRKGYAERWLGKPQQSLDDLRTALQYARKTGTENPNILTFLGDMERAHGNFQQAVELLERSLKLR